jgi:uncharacterized membrane protein YfcA
VQKAGFAGLTPPEVRHTAASVVVPFLVLAMGLGQQHAQATSLVMILPMAVVAILTLRRRGVGDLAVILRISI